jgi:hypothetical protein
MLLPLVTASFTGMAEERFLRGRMASVTSIDASPAQESVADTAKASNIGGSFTPASQTNSTSHFKEQSDAANLPNLTSSQHRLSLQNGTQEGDFDGEVIDTLAQVHMLVLDHILAARKAPIVTVAADSDANATVILNLNSSNQSSESEYAQTSEPGDLTNFTGNSSLESLWGGDWNSSSTMTTTLQPMSIIVDADRLESPSKAASHDVVHTGLFLGVIVMGMVVAICGLLWHCNRVMNSGSNFRELANDPRTPKHVGRSQSEESCTGLASQDLCNINV